MWFFILIIVAAIVVPVVVFNVLKKDDDDDSKTGLTQQYINGKQHFLLFDRDQGKTVNCYAENTINYYMPLCENGFNCEFKIENSCAIMKYKEDQDETFIFKSPVTSDSITREITVTVNDYLLLNSDILCIKTNKGIDKCFSGEKTGASESFTGTEIEIKAKIDYDGNDGIANMYKLRVKGENYCPNGIGNSEDDKGWH